MYIVIADHQESLGMKNEARQTMKRGITKDAQPIEKLQEAISWVVEEKNNITWNNTSKSKLFRF